MKLKDLSDQVKVLQDRLQILESSVKAHESLDAKTWLLTECNEVGVHLARILPVEAEFRSCE